MLHLYLQLKQTLSQAFVPNLTNFSALCFNYCICFLAAVRNTHYTLEQPMLWEGVCFFFFFFKPSGVSNRCAILAKLTDAAAVDCLYTDTPQHDPQLTLAAAALHTQSTLTDAREAAQHPACSTWGWNTTALLLPWHLAYSLLQQIFSSQRRLICWELRFLAPPSLLCKHTKGIPAKNSVSTASTQHPQGIPASSCMGWISGSQ